MRCSNFSNYHPSSSIRHPLSVNMSSRLPENPHLKQVGGVKTSTPRKACHPCHPARQSPTPLRSPRNRSSPVSLPLSISSPQPSPSRHSEAPALSSSMINQDSDQMGYNFKFCCVCSATLRSPRLLPCLHTACLECIENTIASTGNNTFFCPVCRCNSYLSDITPSQLPFNNACRPRKFTPHIPRCNVCNVRQASVQCGDCDTGNKSIILSLCMQCCAASHNSEEVQRHAIAPFPEPLLLCSRHLEHGYGAEYYCSFCNKVICNECRHDDQRCGKHIGCTDALETIKTETLLYQLSGVVGAREEEERLIILHSNIKKRILDVVGASEITLNDLAEGFDFIECALLERKDSLFQELQDEFTVKNQELERQLIEVETAVTALRNGRTSCESFIFGCDNTDRVIMKNTVESRLDSITNVANGIDRQPCALIPAARVISMAPLINAIAKVVIRNDMRPNASPYNGIRVLNEGESFDDTSVSHPNIVAALERKERHLIEWECKIQSRVDSVELQAALVEKKCVELDLKESDINIRLEKLKHLEEQLHQACHDAEEYKQFLEQKYHIDQIPGVKAVRGRAILSELYDAYEKSKSSPSIKPHGASSNDISLAYLRSRAAAMNVQNGSSDINSKSPSEKKLINVGAQRSTWSENYHRKCEERSHV